MKQTIIVIFCLALLAASGMAQEWRKIVPLKTKCEDLKRILGVKECEFPVSNYKFEEFSVNINFNNKYQDYKVSSDTVVSAIIILHVKMNLKDFETDFSDYKITEPDYPGLIYRNEKKGIEFETQKLDGDEYVGSVTFFPTKIKRQSEK